MNIAVMKAGGVGSRMGESFGVPKQYIEVEGKPIIIYSLEPFQNSDRIDKIIIACHKDYIDSTWEEIEKHKITKVSDIVVGGETTQESFFNGVNKAREYIGGSDGAIIMTDAVRPLVRVKDVNNVIDSLDEYGAAVLGFRMSNPVLKSREPDGDYYDYLGINDLFSDSPPQAMKLKRLDEAVRICRERGNLEGVSCLWNLSAYSDLPCTFVQGSEINIKITFDYHVKILETLVKAGVDFEELG